MEKWTKRFIGLALYYSTFSKDPSTKVGCVLVNNQNVPVGLGYNGFSRYSPDRIECLNDRKTKYSKTIHAEENAIYNRTGDIQGSTAYLTHSPCVPCITRLSHNGIKKVVFLVQKGDSKFNKNWCLEDSKNELEELDIEFEIIEITYEEKINILVQAIGDITNG